MEEQAFGNPWIFEEILKHQKISKSKEEIRQIIQKHFLLLLSDKGEYTAVREMRKFISWYVKGLPYATEFRNEMNQVESKEEFIQKIEEFLR